MSKAINSLKKVSFFSSRAGADLLLLLTAVIWGGGFVAQRAASAYLGFFAFNGIRFFLAALVLLPVVLKSKVKIDRGWLWILPAGVLLYVASAFQQAGLESTSAAAGGFITCMYVILVPLFLAFFWKQRSSPVIWAAALAALFGSFLLSTGGKGILPGKGDLLVLAGSVLWALHVIIVGFAVKRVNVYVFSLGQFLLSGLFHLFSSLWADPPTWQNLLACAPAVLYAGIISIGIGFTLQAVGQKNAPPADAALILSLEAVFSAIFGYFVLHEELSTLQAAGCAIIFIATMVAQLFQLAEARKLLKPPANI